MSKCVGLLHLSLAHICTFYLFQGQTLCCANVGILQFLKNDNESYNIGDLSLDLNQKFARYRPLNDRHIEQILRASRMTLRDISQGEEIV